MTNSPTDHRVPTPTQPSASSPRRRHLLAACAALSGVLAASLFVGNGTAAADTVNAQGSGGLYMQVITGAKDYGNHTQYVGTVYITDLHAGWCDAGDPIEGWSANGSDILWYDRTNGCSDGYALTVDRWVTSGAEVCGSFYRYYDVGSWLPWQEHNIKQFRVNACITISV